MTTYFDFLELPQINLEAVNSTQRTFHICGETVWIVNLWKKRWADVASGEIGLHPTLVFNRQTSLGEYVN